MKKILSLVAVAVASVALAAADPILFAHGFAGWNLGSDYHTSGDNVTHPLGTNVDVGAGLAINIPFGGYFGVQPGVDFYFNQFGTKSTSSVTFLGVTTTTESEGMSYYMSLDIPVLLTAKIKKFNFALGPNFSIPLALKSKSKSVVTVDSNSTTSEGDYATPNGSINHFIVGMQFGAGYEERLGMARLIFGARYLLDFMPLTLTTTNSDNSKTVTKLFTRRALFIDIGAKIPLSF